MHTFIYTLTAIILLTMGGNWACRAMFKIADLKPKSSEISTDIRPAGWLIGWLERLILAIGIASGSWEILAAVIALKTVSRFKELDTQDFAEYFLIGSLFSMLWAFVVTSAWLGYDHHFGSGLREQIVEITMMQPKVDKPKVLSD